MKEAKNEEILETDYLIIGAGAVGMAFADIILAETNANIIMVDKHHKPGGHWNLAYPFVRLHQPSTYYGVAVAVAVYVLSLIFGLDFGPTEILVSIIVALVITMPYIGAVSKSIWAHFFFKYNAEIAEKVSKSARA